MIGVLGKRKVEGSKAAPGPGPRSGGSGPTRSADVVEEPAAAREHRHRVPLELEQRAARPQRLSDPPSRQSRPRGSPRGSRPPRRRRRTGRGLPTGPRRWAWPGARRSRRRPTGSPRARHAAARARLVPSGRAVRRATAVRHPSLHPVRARPRACPRLCGCGPRAATSVRIEERRVVHDLDVVTFGFDEQSVGEAELAELVVMPVRLAVRRRVDEPGPRPARGTAPGNARPTSRVPERDLLGEWSVVEEDRHRAARSVEVLVAVGDPRVDRLVHALDPSPSVSGATAPPGAERGS